MGTRGFVGFVVDGTEKIAYNHFDSYPEGLGVNVLRWLGESDHSTARESARVLRVVDDDTEVAEADIERLKPYTDTGVGERSDRPTWYQVLRRTQGKPEAMLDAGVIEDASNFPADSLFAEWGYIIDFDAEVFEVYQGFQHAAHDRGRFAERAGSPRDGYHPCALVASWPLADLPDEAVFLGTVVESEDDE